jgi:tRNA(Met) C34 N-acetyltransferase TmcA
LRNAKGPRWCSYEGTGRSLSLKLIQQLRKESAEVAVRYNTLF